MAKLLIITQKVNKNDQLLGFFVSWLERFSRKFEKITVLCLEKGDFNLPENVEVVSLGKDKGKSKIQQLPTFYFLLSTLNYDAVFVHMNPIWVVLGGIPWRLMRKRIFFWYTSGGVTSKLKLAEKFADVIFTASKESFRLSSKKVIVTGHGIDTDIFRPIPKNVRSDGKVRDVQDEKTIQPDKAIQQLQQAGGDPTTSTSWRRSNSSIKLLSIGRIAPVKNYGTLIEAAKILKDQGINFVVTMVGELALSRDQNYVLSIKEKIKDLGLEDKFNFIGKIDHEKLPEVYRSHDIFVHLSKTGSIDKVLLEAMACGINVLSSSDSARVFLKQEMIFEENNSQELADKIKDIQNKSYGQELRNYVLENHNLDKLINKISDHIQS